MNGTSAAATDTDCIGETSMYWISDGGLSSVSAWKRQGTKGAWKLPSLFNSALA